MSRLIDASQNRIENYKEAVQILLAEGIDPNIQDNNGNTALILASYHGYIEIVRLLLTANANPNIQNNIGNTALILASMQGHTEIVRLLLDSNGANIANLQNNNMVILL